MKVGLRIYAWADLRFPSPAETPPEDFTLPVRQKTRKRAMHLQAIPPICSRTALLFSVKPTAAGPAARKVCELHKREEVQDQQMIRTSSLLIIYPEGCTKMHSSKSGTSSKLQITKTSPREDSQSFPAQQ